MKKILTRIVLVLVIIIIGFLAFVNLSYDKNYNEEFPITVLKVPNDSSLIAKGKYLVNGPAHCAHCHVPLKDLEKVEAGEEVAFVGGFDLTIPPGTFRASNITSDRETGIGDLSDGELYRMMRYNINHRGQACVDFMPFINMAEEDIHAIIAYIRTLPATKSPKEPTELSMLGKFIYATGGVKPGVPDEPVLQRMEPEVSIEYGKYLAYAVANCRGCHTNRDMKSGKYIGEDYAGGFVFGPDNMTQGFQFVPPNLTPDPETGVMYDWTEEKFITRMKGGRVHATSPMPWSAFASMNENDLKAIYMFLKSLDPVKNDVGKTVIEPEA